MSQRKMIRACSDGATVCVTLIPEFMTHPRAAIKWKSCNQRLKILALGLVTYQDSTAEAVIRYQAITLSI